MKRTALALVAAASVMACTTTASDLRNRPPVHTFQTAKPPVRVAQFSGLMFMLRKLP